MVFCKRFSNPNQRRFRKNTLNLHGSPILLFTLIITLFIFISEDNLEFQAELFMRLDQRD